MTTATTRTSTTRPDRRTRLRAATLEEIRAEALRQVRSKGAPALSLRGVARGIGLSSAGIYRYYASRDDLITDLVAQAYRELATAIEAAAEGKAAPFGVVAVGTALAEWALAHPVDYALLFDEPIPGYVAPPAGPTVTAAARFEAAVAAPLLAAWRTAQAGAQANTSTRSGAHDDPAFSQAFAASWTRLHGVLSLHLHGHLTHMGLDQAAVLRLYHHEVDACLTLLTTPRKPG